MRRVIEGVTQREVATYRPKSQRTNCAQRIGMICRKFLGIARRV